MSALRKNHRRGLAAVIAGLALVTGIAAAIVLVPSNPASAAEGLEAFGSCDALLEYAKREALERVTAWGLDGHWIGPYPEAFGVDFAEAGGDGGIPTPAGTAADEAGTGFSRTNIQEAGIDEPDLVKTNGEIIAVVAGETLYLLSPDLEILGTLDLAESGWFAEMFLVDGRVILLGHRGGGYPVPVASPTDFMPYYGDVTAIAEIDVTDPAAPDLIRTTYIDGRYLSARLHGSVARIVIASYPTGLDFVYPEGAGLRAEREALAANRRVIEESTIENWLPYYLEIDHHTGTESEGLLLDCRKAHHPKEFSGFGMLTIAAFGASGLEDAAGVMADGETVYASADTIYVATNRWNDPWLETRRGDAPGTAIHAFAIDAGAIQYTASGSVPGYLINQFAMSEWEGHLRVATTTLPSGWWDETSVSQVTVLRRNGKRLVAVGEVGGLGVGEQIHSVRFLGATGYVVTFRQVDPLYVIDLGDPTDPRVAGELKITGYSAYLHPAGDGRIIGVGQEATEAGRTTGSQVSMFDVSDPGDPQRLFRYMLSDAWSAVEWDHRAFLLWGDVLVMPIETWSAGIREGDAGTADEWFSGALVLRVGDGFEEIGMIEQAGGVQRSLVIGETLYLVGYQGIQAVALADLEPIASIGFEPGGGIDLPVVDSIELDD
jgi:uncharacterized secreted protein with C-terminal beta-propeller domain